MRALFPIVTTLSLSLGATLASAVQLPAPPDLAERSKYQTNEEVVRLDAPLDEAWAFWTSNNITDFLEPTDRIPAIETITVLEGTWGEPGAIRRVELADGSKLRSKGRQFVKNGARLRLSLPGGGGYGTPGDRDRARIAADLGAGLITSEEARDDYGYEG